MMQSMPLALRVATFAVLLQACDHGKSTGPGDASESVAEPEVASPVPPAPPPAAERSPASAPDLDGLLRFEVSGLESADQAAWLKELFNRQDILRVERISHEDGIVEIRYATRQTDREKLTRMLEVNQLTVRKVSYLDPDPDRSG